MTLPSTPTTQARIRVTCVGNIFFDISNVNFSIGAVAPGPALVSILPTSGGTPGGTVVSVSGTQFVDGATVFFGTVEATAVTFHDATSLTATAPAHVAGLVDVTVTNPDTLSDVLGSAFTYFPDLPFGDGFEVDGTAAWSLAVPRRSRRPRASGVRPVPTFTLRATRKMLILGNHEANTLEQLQSVAKRAHRVALMADGHLGYIMPVGGVAAYRRQISVAGVGFDIACGNCAMRTDLVVADLSRPRLELLADRIQREISFGIGRTNASRDAPVEDPLFDDASWQAVPANPVERERLRKLARDQLGTVGSGNHYVDLFADEADRVWVGVHFGSRGLGHTIASGFMAIAAGKSWGDRVPESETLLDLASDSGDRYWRLMELAGRYAYAGREWVCRKVATAIVGGEVCDRVHNHHNFAWREHHFGEELIVVRKGATPAFPGQVGFVGASMTGVSVVLRGVTLAGDAGGESAAQRAAMFSTVHGAGRVMSRTEAAGKRHRFGAKAGALVRGADGEPVRPGKVTEEMLRSAVKASGVVLRGGGLDESPFVYRQLGAVLAEQPGIEIVHRLRPLAVVMAGADEHDPYRD